MRLTFPSGEWRDLPDDTPQEYVDRLVGAYHQYGSLAAIDQWSQLDSLRENPEFLALPRLERHRIFNDFATASPEFWNFESMTPDRRRLYRDHIVEAGGANEQDTFSHGEAPIHFKDEINKATDGVIAEFFHALKRSTPQVTAHITSGFANLAAEGAQKLSPGADTYLAPLGDPERRHRTAADMATEPTKPGLLDSLATEARAMASDVSIGSETLAPPPKVDRFGKVHGWDSFSMYLAQLAGQQTPVMGSMIAAGLIPGVGTAAAFATGMALETGSILEDLEKQGLDPEASRGTAALYGVLAGALEALPIAAFLKRTPGVNRTFKQALGQRLVNSGVQAIEEAGTEGLQTLVEQTAIDVVNAERGNLEAISWMTDEGRRSLWDDASEAMIAGGIMGGAMGAFGGTNRESGPPGPEPAPDVAPDAGTAPPDTGMTHPGTFAEEPGELGDQPMQDAARPTTDEEIARELERQGGVVDELPAPPEGAVWAEGQWWSRDGKALGNQFDRKAGQPKPDIADIDIPPLGPKVETEKKRPAIFSWSQGTWDKFKKQVEDAKAKMPWEETKEEFSVEASEEQKEAVGKNHKIWVEAAIERGEAIPENVLAQYPDLQEQKTEGPAETQSEPVTEPVSEAPPVTDLTGRVQEHEDVVKSAMADRKKLSHEAEKAMHDSERGIFVGQPTPIDRHVADNDEIYKAFEPTRQLLREKFGDTIKLYRAEHIKAKHRRVKEGSKTTLNFASKAQAEEFMGEEFGQREIITKEIPVDDIVAVNVGSKGRYEEFIVRNPDLKSEPVSEAAPKGAVQPKTMKQDGLTFPESVLTGRLPRMRKAAEERQSVEKRKKSKEPMPAVPTPKQMGLPETPVGATVTEPLGEGADIPTGEFVKKAVPQLQSRVKQLEKMLWDTDTFAQGDVYDGSFPIPKEGGIQAATATLAYGEDRQYRGKVNQAIKDINDTIVKAERQLAILEQATKGDLQFLSEKVSGGYIANAERAWRMEAISKYKSVSAHELGNISVREGFQNAVDAVTQALFAGDIKRGKIDLQIIDANGDQLTYGTSGTGYIIEDNGIGMSDVDIRDVFLSLHSTGKDNELVVGGFGTGKAVALFPTLEAEWRLQTRDNYFDGEMAAAQDQIATLSKPVKGTHLEVQGKTVSMDSKAWMYVEASEIPDTTIKVNGEKPGNPFKGAKGETRTMEHTTGEGDKAVTHTYEVTYYDIALGNQEGAENLKGYYGSQLITRVVNPKTGVKLVQSIEYIYNSKVDGTMIMDITTTATPGQAEYPLDNARLRIEDTAREPINKWLEEISDKKKQGPKEEQLDLTTRLLTSFGRWPKVIESLKKDKKYQNLLKVIEEEFEIEGVDQGEYGGLTPIDQLNIEVEKGYSASKGNKAHAYYFAIFEASTRIMAARLGIKVSEFRPMYLKSSLDTDGKVTYAAYNAFFKQMFLNPNAIRETAFTGPLHFAMYIKDIVDHELTHDKVQNHTERFTSALAFDTQPATRTVVPSLVRMAEAYLDVQETSLWREKAREQGKEIEDVLVEEGVEPKVIEKVMYGQQLDFPMDLAPIGTGGIYDDLFYPQKEGEDWQIGLFGEGVGRRTAHFRGDTTHADAGSTAKQPSGQSDAVASEGSVEAGEEASARSRGYEADYSRTVEDLNEGDWIVRDDWTRAQVETVEGDTEGGYTVYFSNGKSDWFRAGESLKLANEIDRKPSKEIEWSDEGSPDFDAELLDPQYGGKNKQPVTLANIRAALKGWAVKELPGGGYSMTMPGKKPLILRWTTQMWEAGILGADEEKVIQKFADDYNTTTDRIRRLIATGMINATLKGFHRNDTINGIHLIVLSEPNAGPATMFHEAFHFAFNTVMTPVQRARILSEFGTEEKAAKAYGDLAATQFKLESGRQLTVGERLLRQMWEIAKAQVKVIFGNDYKTAQDILEDLYHGKIWQQPWLGHLANRQTDPLGYYRVNDGEVAQIAAELRTAVDADEIIKANLAPAMTEKAMLAAWENSIPLSMVKHVTEGDVLFEMDDLERDPVRVADPDMAVEYAPDMAVGGDGNLQDPGTVMTRKLVKEWIREHVTRKFFDKLAPIKWLQEKLTESGIKINESMNGYLMARNFSGRAGALMKWVETHLFDPFIKEIARLDIDLKTFDEFRMALRLLELNPHLYRMHVVIPRAALKQLIEQIEKRGIRVGQKVRLPQDPKLAGKVTKIEGDNVTIEYMDPDTLEATTIESHKDHVNTDALAEAKEKLAAIEKMNLEGTVPHAGMKSAQARQLLRDYREWGLINFEGDPNNKTKYTGDLMKASGLFDKITRWKEETLLKAGLITNAELTAWRKIGKYYAPMRGKSEPDLLDYLLGGDRPPIPNIEPHGSMWHRSLDVLAKAAGHHGEIFTPNIGKGYNPGRRAAARRALGRQSLPSHSPSVELFADAMELAIRSERNRVGQTMLNLFKAMSGLKDKSGRPLIIIDEPPKKRVYDEKTKTVKLINDNLALSKANVYNIWINGNLHFVRSDSTEMAGLFAVLNNVGPEAAPKVLRTFAAINRYIAKMATSRNPAFAIPNLVRDFLTAGVRLSSDEEYKALGKGILTRIPKNIKILAQYARAESKGELDKIDPELKKRIEKFKLAGGETAFWMIPRLEVQHKNLMGEIDSAAKRNSRIFRWGRQVLDFLEDYNGALEATARFSVFEAALEKGVSLDKAALMAREITVDFTQQGELAGWMGSLWVFSNASLQGSRMVYNTLFKTDIGKKRWLPALISIGIMQAMLNRFAGGEDPEDEIPYWDKITDYEKSRNLIIMTPWAGKGTRIKIPMPWGFNVPVMVGQMVTDAAFGAKTPWETAAAITSSGMSAFNPIGDNDLRELSGWYQMVAPSWLDPTTDIVLNKTFWGGPIMPTSSAFKKSEQYGIPQLDHERYFSSASWFGKEATKGLYKLTGISISPETLDYSISAWAGGLGDTVQKAINLVPAAATRHKLAAHELPIVRSFYATESHFYAPQLYRANMGQYWEKYETLREMKKEGDPGTAAYAQRWSHLLTLKAQVKTFEDSVKALRKAGVKQDDSRLQRLYKKFNLLYDRTEANNRRNQKKKRSIMK